MAAGQHLHIPSLTGAMCAAGKEKPADAVRRSFSLPSEDRLAMGQALGDSALWMGAWAFWGFDFGV